MHINSGLNPINPEPAPESPVQSRGVRAGTVTLVGGGPGDPGLLTLRGARALQDATVVAYDDLVHAGLLNLAPRARHVFVGKRAGWAAMTQEQIEDLLIREAKAGETVVRLKGGDPFIFGRGAEEVASCQRVGLTVDVVPGISSALAAPAYGGIPVTLRGVSASVHIVSGHEDPTKEQSQVDWRGLGAMPGTLVILMGVGRLPQIAAELVAGGKSPDTPAAAVVWGTRAAQAVVRATLTTLSAEMVAAGVGSPAVIVVGDVAKAEASIDWLSQARPLHGKTVALTRPTGKGTDLRHALEALGADVREAPLLKVQARSAPAEADLLANPASCLVFSSAAGVELYMAALQKWSKDSRSLAGRTIVAVGPATAAALRGHGICPDSEAAVSRQEGILTTIKGITNINNVVLMRGEPSRDVLERGLQELGYSVATVCLYDTYPDAEGARLIADWVSAGDVDLVVLTSAGGVRSLRSELEKRMIKGKRPVWLSIGPVTTEAIREAGWENVIEAATPEYTSLLQAAICWVRSGSTGS